MKLKAQSTGSMSKAFDASSYDVRFKVEPGQLHPMSLDLAWAAFFERRNILRLILCKSKTHCIVVKLSHFQLRVKD